VSSFRELNSEWQCPSAIYRGAPFWSWNSKLDPDRLGRAIDSRRNAGLGGFFIHRRYGLKTAYLSDEWFECVSACVEHARRTGMKAHLYDEDRWPSRPAGGRGTREHPEFGLHYLALVEKPAEGEKVLGRFSVELDADGRMLGYGASGRGKGVAFVLRRQGPVGYHNDGAYLDTMNPSAVDAFIRVTHDAYAERYAVDFGDLVPSMFTDEPNFGYWVTAALSGAAAIVWTPALPEEFARRRGYDVLSHLPELFFASVGEDFSKVRHDYMRTVTELFVESFTQRVGRWCEEHHLPLTGHVLLEGGLQIQMSAVGACMPHYEHMQWPGIDILCDQADELITAKQCASVADQLGKERVLSELYGCTGWDWPLEGHKFGGDWQLATGVNLRCPHLTHYSLAGGAKRDYPASIFHHTPWWRYYSTVETYFARLCYMLTQGTPVRDVLLLHPIESAWGLYLPARADQTEALGEMESTLRAIMYGLSGQHLDGDFADESLLARHGAVSGSHATLFRGGRMVYKAVLVPPCVTLRSTTVALLTEFATQGGAVIFLGRTPTMVDAKPATGLGRLLSRSTRLEGDANRYADAVAKRLPRRVSLREGGKELRSVWYMLREVSGHQVLFVQSHDRKAGHTVQVDVKGIGPVVLWDALSGEKHVLAAEFADGRVRFTLALGPTGSALVTLGLPVPDAHLRPQPPRVVRPETLSGPFAATLTEPNTLPLDYCRFRVGEDEWSDLVPTLKADQLIRARYGLGTRLGEEPQPWYLYATGTVDTGPRDPCEMRWEFRVTDVPATLKLAVEAPQDYEILVNGQCPGEPDGWWVDEDIRTLDIAHLTRKGDTEVLLRFVYRPDMELEDLYLVGDFAVKRRGKEAPAPGRVTLLTPKPTLALGSWVGQGLDFYGGAVRYSIEVEKPAAGQGVRVRLPGVACTCAALHVNGKVFVLPWAPFEADVTSALRDGPNTVEIEVVGGRKNILGPLHTPWGMGTGPHSFSPDNGEWTFEYHLTDHGLMEPVVVEVTEAG